MDFNPILCAEFKSGLKFYIGHETARKITNNNWNNVRSRETELKKLFKIQNAII